MPTGTSRCFCFRYIRRSAERYYRFEMFATARVGFEHFGNGVEIDFAVDELIDVDRFIRKHVDRYARASYAVQLLQVCQLQRPKEIFQ